MAQGVRVNEPVAGSANIEVVDSVDVDFNSGDLRKRQRVVLSGNSPTSPDVFSRTSAASATDGGLVVHVATTPVVTTDIRTNGAVVSTTNRLPSQAVIVGPDGVNAVSTTNRLPVDIAGATVSATFSSYTDPNNATQTPLAASATFTGQWFDVLNYAAITVAIQSDAPSAANGVIAEFSVDGVNVITTITSTYPGGNAGAYFSIPIEARYFRTRYVNGATAQTTVRSGVIYEFTAPAGAQQALGGPLTDANIGGVQRSVITGRLSTGQLKTLATNAAGELAVNIANPSIAPNAVATGTLAAASAYTASQTYAPAAPATAVMLTVPAGHASWQITLNGTFSTTSQVFFEGSETGADADWFALNGRRNADATTNDETTLLDANPFGGPSPAGAGVSYWRGSTAGVNYLRVRCGTFTAADAIGVRITTSVGVGAVFQNAAAPLAADNFKSGSLAAAGDTVVVSAAGSGAWSVYMNGNYTGTVYFEASVDGVNFNKINGAVQGVGTLQTQFVGTGTANQSLQVRGGSGGLKNIRLRAGADFVGSFVGTLRTGAGTGGVYLTAPVPIAGLSNGAQTLRQSVGITAVRIDPSVLTTRTSVEIKYHANGATNNSYVYVAFSSGVGVGTGRELSPGESWTLDLTSTTQIWAIATTAGQPVQVTEIG